MYNLSKTTECDDWLKHVSDSADCAGPWQQVALLQLYSASACVSVHPAYVIFQMFCTLCQ